jgi:hypothetical protein
VKIPGLIFDLFPNLFSQAVPCARQQREGGANDPRNFKPELARGKAQKNGIENGIDYHHCFIIENGIKKATV